MEREAVREALSADGVQTSIHYPPIHYLSAFSHEGDAELPVTNRVADRLLTLPLHPLLEDEDVEYVSEALLAAVPLP